MVTDQQVRLLMKLSKTEKTLSIAAVKAGMDEKTARKYRGLRRLPSKVQVEHTWRTRKDPFANVWAELEDKLGTNPGLQAKTLFDDLQRRYPGRFADGQLRTLQRRVKVWRALKGPAKEVFFPQQHHPGVLAQSSCRSHLPASNRLETLARISFRSITFSQYHENEGILQLVKWLSARY